MTSRGTHKTSGVRPGSFQLYRVSGICSENWPSNSPAPVSYTSRFTLSGLSNQLDRKRHRLAAAQAERGQTAPPAALLERMDQRDQHPRAARADRVPQGDRAAVN